MTFVDQANGSVGAIFAIGPRAPSAVQPLIVQAVSDSLMHGFTIACVVVSGIALFSSIIALKFLPARVESATSVLSTDRGYL